MTTQPQPNAAAVRAYRDALNMVGKTITVIRISGTAPRTVTFSAEVAAIVHDELPFADAAQRTGYSDRSVGGITQGSRSVILLAEDLRLKRFPLPLRKNDKVVLPGGDRLNVISVDAEKRSFAGAVELSIAGVQ